MVSSLVIGSILIILLGAVQTIQAFSSFPPTSNNFNYCQIKCTRKKIVYNHTMCLRPQCPIEGSCSKVQQIPLTPSEEAFILHTHNKYRNIVAKGDAPGQPPAANMKELVWDDELAKIAQCWANSCNFEHDKCRKTQKGVEVGQNIGVYGTTRSRSTLKGRDSLERIIRNWYREVIMFNRKDIKRYKSNAKVGHYTQLAWANTSRVGCARIFGFKLKKRKTFHRVFLYCNYSEAGNWLKESVYVEGTSCKSCHCSMKYRHLCENNERQ